MSRAYSRRGFLGHVAGACLATTALTTATAQPVDPVYLAIDAVKSNLLAIDNLMERQAEHIAHHGRMNDQMRAEEDAVLSAYEAAARGFLKTVPTTKAGMVAYLDFIATRWGWEGCQMERFETDAMCATFRAYVQREGRA